MLILYSGIHYDALAITSSEHASPDMDSTIFTVNQDSEEIVQAAIQLAGQMKKVFEFFYLLFTARFETKNLFVGP